MRLGGERKSTFDLTGRDALLRRESKKNCERNFFRDAMLKKNILVNMVGVATRKRRFGEAETSTHIMN